MGAWHSLVIEKYCSAGNSFLGDYDHDGLSSCLPVKSKSLRARSFYQIWFFFSGGENWEVPGRWICRKFPTSNCQRCTVRWTLHSVTRYPNCSGLVVAESFACGTLSLPR